MNCRKVTEVVYFYVDNELDNELLPSFRQHVDSCPMCRRQIRRAELVVTLVRRRCLRAATPDHLRQRILTSLPHRRI